MLPFQVRSLGPYVPRIRATRLKRLCQERMSLSLAHYHSLCIDQNESMDTRNKTSWFRNVEARKGTRVEIFRSKSKGKK